MSWKKYPFNLIESQDSRIISETFGTNENCFIRKEHKCGKIIGASKSCFIACPTDDTIEPILGLISEKLSKVAIEPIIAVKERAYGQDIFCTKICGKIIESKFCLVILDDYIKNKTNIPNPNVYYEYGLMTTLRKHIIPLQREDLKLAFNIQSYDTIKYNNKNIGVELDRAIKEAIRITESSKTPLATSGKNDKTILRKLELEDFILKDNNWFLFDVIEDTNFKGFGQYRKNIYIYLAKIDDKIELQPCLEDLDIVLHRTEKRYKELIEKQEQLNISKITLIEELDSSEEKLRGSFRPKTSDRVLSDIDRQLKDLNERIELMKHFYIGFISNPSVEFDEFIEKAEAMISKYDEKYHLIYNDNEELVIEETKIKLNISNF